MWREWLVAEARQEALADRPGYVLLGSVGLLGLCGAIYGATLGSWRGGRQILLAAIKLPLVFLVTVALSLLFLRLTALLLGLRLGLGDAARLTLLAMAIAAILLASLSPPLWLFTWSAPPPGPEARTAHNLLFLLHTLAVAAAGCTGSWVLRDSLYRLAGSRRRGRKILWIWVMTLALVGGEVAWAFRPFVGSIYLPARFLREEALDGNVYEFIFLDILPHLRGDLPGGRDDHE